MPCTVLEFPGGQTAIACSRGQRGVHCSICGAKATRLCDYALRGRKAGTTCDRKLCHRCAVKMGRDRKGSTIDYCPAHAEVVRAQPALPGLGVSDQHV